MTIVVEMNEAIVFFCVDGDGDGGVEVRMEMMELRRDGEVEMVVEGS